MVGCTAIVFFNKSPMYIPGKEMRMGQLYFIILITKKTKQNQKILHLFNKAFTISEINQSLK